MAQSATYGTQAMPPHSVAKLRQFYLRMNTEFASIMPGLGSSALVKRDGLFLSWVHCHAAPGTGPAAFSDRQDLIMPNLATARTSLPQIASAQRAAPGATPAADRRAPWLARLRVWLRGDARLAERLNAVDWSL